MLLITELTEEVNVLKEEKDGKSNYFIEGIIMQGDIKNRNGRVYPKKTLVKETTRYNENYVNKKRAYGELGHPDGPTINLDRVSHMFTELKEDGSNIIGRAKIMDTPMGKIVKNFIDEGAYLGISSRGMGSLKRNSDGILEVQEDFMLATAGDLVADPSGPNCYVNGIMEGVEFYYDLASKSWIPDDAMKVIDDHVEEMHESYTKIDNQRKFQMLEEFLRKL